MTGTVRIRRGAWPGLAAALVAMVRLEEGREDR